MARCNKKDSNGENASIPNKIQTERKQWCC